MIALITDTLPMVLQLSHIGRTYIINWIPEGYHYYFQFLSTQSESWKPVNNATISLDLNTTFNQIAISICPEGTKASRFIIGL